MTIGNKVCKFSILSLGKAQHSVKYYEGPETREKLGRVAPEKEGEPRAQQAFCHGLREAELLT